MSAYPADLSGGNAHHQGVGWHAAVNHRSCADKGILADCHPANNGAVGAQARSLSYKSVAIFIFTWYGRTGIVDICEYHARAAEHVVLEKDIVIYGNVVLNLDVVPDHYLVADKHILAERASCPYDGASTNMHPMPDSGFSADLRTLIDDGGGMSRIAGTHEDQ